MSDPARSNLRGAVLALLSFALYSTHDAVVKTLGRTVSPFEIVFFATLLSFPWLMLMLMRDTEKATLLPVHPWWTAARMAASAITAVTAFYAFTAIPLAQVYALLFATPLLITILSVPILGERVGPHRWAAVVLGLVGVLVVIRPGSAPFALGHLAAMIAACSSSLVAIIVRRIGRDERRAVLIAYPMMGNFVVMGCALPFVYTPLPLADLGALALMSGLAFAAVALIIAAYTLADAAVVAPMQYSQMLWAALFGAFLFDERPDGATWIGAAIIVASGLYIVLRETMGGSKTTPVSLTKARPETGTSPRDPVVRPAE